MEQDAAFARDRAHGLDRLDRPDLVVGVDDAHDDRPGCDRPAYVIGVDATAAIWIEVRHARAEALEEAGRLEDRGMLYRGRDDVVAALAQGEEGPLERQVVGLTAAAREHDLVGGRAKQRRDLGPCPVHDGAGRPTTRMRGRRIGEGAVEHCLVHNSLRTAPDVAVEIRHGAPAGSGSV